MKLKSPFLNSSRFLTLCMAVAAPVAVHGAEFTWDGGGADTNWSTPENWVGDLAPAAIDDTLVFDGSVGLTNTNDFITALGDPAITIAETAGSFVLGDDGIVGPVTIGIGSGGNSAIVSLLGTADQEIAFDINLSGGNRDRNILFPATGGGTVTFSGDIDFANDWIFPTQGVGTVVLTGNNTGDGHSHLTGGTNVMRAMCRLNTNGQTLVLGSPTALGNPNVDSTDLRGIRMNTGNQVLTTLNDMDLTGANMVNSTISWNESTSFVGAGDLEVGGMVYTKNNGRAWSVDGGGEFIVSGAGVFLTSRTAAQVMILQPLNGNVITINGPVHDTFQSGGIETQTGGYGSVPTDGLLRLQGDGTVNLNADNSATMNAEVFLNSANVTVKLGDANALGTFGETSVTITNSPLAQVYLDDNGIDVDDLTGIELGDAVSGPGIQDGSVVDAIDVDGMLITLSLPAIADATDATVTFSRTATEVAGRTNMNSGTLDLNGFAVSETFVNVSGNSAFANSNTSSTAQLLTEILNQGSPTFEGPGDFIVNNIRHEGGITRRITKNGTGTLTLGGDQDNGRYGLTVNEGDVILAKTAGEAVARFPLIINNAASTVTFTNTGDQIGNQTDGNGMHQINEGTLDLNGFSDSFGALSTSNGTEPGGVVTNGDAGTTSTLTLLGAGADATFPGTVSGNMNIVKNGAFVQTFSGTASYTGDTTINDGTLELSATSDLADTSTVSIDGATSILKLADGVTDTVNALWLDGTQVEAGTYGATGSGADNIDDVHFTGTGVLDVTTGPAAGTDYDTWAALYAPADLTDMTGDNDNDGLTNQQEYAYGLNPVSGSSVNPYIAEFDTASGTFTYQRRKASLNGLTYEVEFSLDLVTWSVDGGTTQVATEIDANNESVLVTIPGPLPTDKAFVRVKAQ